MDRAMFINVLIEGKSPTFPVTKTELSSWVSFEELAFTCVKDLDGVAFNAQTILGAVMTGYIVERATRKVVVKDLPETDVLKKLDTLP
jgi:hypothetical protein